MSIDEQIGHIVLAHQEGLEEGLKRHEATIAKLQAENAKFVADSAAKDAAYEARIKELEALLAQKG